ncbi:hypothetical protein JB92DRAFT_3112125 [Gautieria morchelliformis]|nr:hypothetical protein JB92DRAFT_3112125 [Gautieria morchelliformis]
MLFLPPHTRLHGVEYPVLAVLLSQYFFLEMIHLQKDPATRSYFPVLVSNLRPVSKLCSDPTATLTPSPSIPPRSHHHSVKPEIERNYQIFYQLCTGAPLKEWKDLVLDIDITKFFYLKQGGPSSTPIPNFNAAAPDAPTHPRLEHLMMFNSSSAYLAHYMPDVSTYITPLLGCVRNNCPFEWTPLLHKCLQNIKALVCVKIGF